MATLVLGAVGTLIGGPIGGSIGALIGNRIDSAVLAPKGRQGPRLGDLRVQTSSYGSPLPKLFGTMRVAGTVIWATDLMEDRHSSGSAKSGGKTTTYSYSASFAVALSARPIQSIGRIWADGNLLRGAAGDWKSETGFRLHPGSEDQAIDPLIAAAEGIAAAPAHRGIAYAVFEGLQLADFGNRIPLLTFEVIADAGPVAASAIAAALSGGVLVGGGDDAVAGFAASGDSVRGALEALTRAFPMPLADDGQAIRIADPTIIAIAAAQMGAAAQGTAPAHSRTRAAAASLADSVTLSHYDPARDHQAGLQSARRDGIGRRSDRIELPAAVAADTAKTLAEDALARAWIGREQAMVRMPWRSIGARAGTLVTLDGDAPWRIVGWSLERMVIALSLRREAEAGAVTVADAGRARVAPDLGAGTTIVALLDLPSLADGAAEAPQLWLAAAGTAPGWRRATVSLSLDGGTSWQPAGQTAFPAVIGYAAGALAGGSSTLFDDVNLVEIVMPHAGMVLQGADDDALIAGANAAMLGDEIIQFGVAIQLSPIRWRLSRLLRGRRGSEAGIATHVAGERFVLLDQATLLPLAIPVTALGTTATVLAQGPGDGATPVTGSCAVVGRAIRPPAPVDLRAELLPDGKVRFGWTRRSRLGWAWLDRADAPLGEDAERYRLTLTPAIGTPRTIDLVAPAFDYSPADRAADGAGSAPRIAATLVQVGTYAASDPATIIWIA